MTNTVISWLIFMDSTQPQNSRNLNPSKLITHMLLAEVQTACHITEAGTPQQE